MRECTRLLRESTLALSLRGLGFRRDTRLLMGWLGPRGLASVVFTLIGLEAFREVARPEEVLLATAGWTILLSVLFHGFSARPLARWYAGRLRSAPVSIPELFDVPDLERPEGRLTGLQTPPPEPEDSASKRQ